LALDRYRAWRVPVSLDCERMQRAAQYLIGKHDFTTFRSSICQAQSPVKTVSGITISGDGPAKQGHAKLYTDPAPNMNAYR
jgi:tRNA pseudouridine38-40 synthase